MAEDAVLVEKQGPIAHIILNRPGKRNALNWEMWRQLADAVDDVASDQNLRVVVVRGAEARVFAAGADIEEFERIFASVQSSAAYTQCLLNAQNKLAKLSLPTIAQIQGPCMGGGCGIALCCDLRFADDTALFAIPVAKLGLAYGLADTKRLVDIVGLSKAKHMLFTAAVMDAQEALAIGLVDRVVEARSLAAETEVYAQSICQLSRFTTRATKQIVQMSLDGVSQDTDDTRQLFMDGFNGEDFKEGRAAFLEKRKAKFSFSG